MAQGLAGTPVAGGMEWMVMSVSLLPRRLRPNISLSLSKSADRVAQRLGHLVPNRDVTGSNPALGTIFLYGPKIKKNDATSRIRTGDLSVTEAVP